MDEAEKVLREYKRDWENERKACRDKGKEMARREIAKRLVRLDQFTDGFIGLVVDLPVEQITKIRLSLTKKAEKGEQG